jgi:acyl CoA:acetate/3-ketoacid CoA transferase beta subunit
MLRHTPRAFVDRLDFRTTGGGGVSCVVTDLGVLEPDDDDGELVLRELHAGATVEDAQEATGWELRVAADVRGGSPPTADELQALRALRPASDDTVRA